MLILDRVAVASKWPFLLLLLAVLTISTTILRTRLRKGLRDIPGPALASISSIPRLLTAASGHIYAVHIDYHKRFGNVVRIGPYHVSISDASVIPQIYNITTNFYKSTFYRVFDVKTPNGPVPTVFSVTAEAKHRAMKRPVANAYSMGTMVELEPMTNECIQILERKMDERLGQDVDLGMWLHWYAFDVILSVTFSNRLEFMEKEMDVAGIIAAIDGRLMYNSVIGQAFGLHKYLLGNALISKMANWVPAIAKLNSAKYIAEFSGKQLDRYTTAGKSAEGLRDMLDRFKKYKDGEKTMSDAELLSHSASNVLAGSDTTAISLRAMFYYLCKNPASYKRLVLEIDELDTAGQLSDPVTFHEANHMPYLQACMKEAMRLHPAVGFLLERVVPQGGATLAGNWLPEGTVVGVNPWVVARDKTVYGEDAEAFRPERWLEKDAFKLKMMEASFLAFGAGARTCLGKNVSLLEMSKLVPQMLRKYTIDLADPAREWELHDYWFVQQTGLICRFSRRDRNVVQPQ